MINHLKMEADSTTYERNIKSEVVDTGLPFSTSLVDFQLYNDLTSSTSEQRLECQLVERLQAFGLLPSRVTCPTSKPECVVNCKTARVVDKMQWICKGCGKRQPIRTQSFFLRLQCSILQALQVIFAWSEDADIDVAAEHFGIKPKLVTQIYDKIDELAIKEQNNCKLGGENSVVLAEIYPDCVNRLSPDTTDQPHVHRILMLADTNHIPTRYCLHVLKENNKSSNNNTNNQILKSQIEEVISKAVIPNSLIVTGNHVPQIEGASSIQQLFQHCDLDMQHFLSSRIWRQAVTISSASRSLCSNNMAAAPCAAAAQRYLTSSLFRLHHDAGLYRHILNTIAHEFTDQCHT